MKICKKLLLIGYFPEDASVYGYASSFIRPLQKLGFEVQTFNYRNNYLSCNWFKSCALVNQHIINQQLHYTALKFKPDIIFCLKAETIFPKTLRIIKKFCASYLINFYPDSPFALWNGNSTINIIKSFSLYDQFLIWSYELLPALISAGCKNVSYFPFAFDQDIFAKNIIILPFEKKYFSSDVCFIGTWEPERERWLQNLCERLPMINVAIWGNEWTKNINQTSLLYDKIRGNAIYGCQMRKAFACSKIVLNFIRQQNIQAHNMRTFEVPASNAFLLTQRTHDQASLLFKEGESIVCFSTLEELVEKIIFYLNNNENRLNITQKSFLCAQEFTLEQQLAKLFTSLIKKKELDVAAQKTKDCSSFVA